MVHHDLWDLDPSAAPQLTTIRHNGRNRDVVVVTGKTGWLYVFDRVTGEPIWPIEERPVPKTDMPGEESWPTQPYPTNPPPFAKHTFSVDDISPYLPPEEAETFKKRLLAADNKGIFTPISFKDTVHVPTSNGGVLFGGTAAEPGTGAVYVVAHDNPGILRLLRPGEGRGGGAAAVPPGQARLSAELPDVPRRRSPGHGKRRAARPRGRPIRRTTSRPARRASTRPRSARSSRPARAACRRSRISPPPTSTTLVAFLTTPAGGRGAVRRPRAAAPVRRVRRAAGVDCRIGFGVDAAGRARRTRTRRRRRIRRACPTSTRYTINEYNTVGNRIKPPFTTIVKYDLNEPAIKWRIGFGDDPALAARGITGTGMPAHRQRHHRHRIGPRVRRRRDNQIRAWDSDTGRQLWSSRFGGNFVGSPVMYEMDGRQYLLVPGGERGGWPRRRSCADPGRRQNGADGLGGLCPSGEVVTSGTHRGSRPHSTVDHS